MTTISYPFRIDEHGSVGATRDPSKINLDRVRSVLSTQVGDRPMRPSFGTNTTQLIMDDDRYAERDMHSMVAQSFRDQLPDLHLVRTQLTYDPQNRLTATLLVEFNGPDGATDVASVSFVDGIVAYDPNLISEVNQ